MDTLVVNYAVGGSASGGSDYTALSGSATPGADYVALPGTITIPAGESYTTITVTPLDDLIAEPDETVVVSLLGGVD